MKTVGIHQPEAFPWLGFLDKALRSDVFILLDDVQFEKNYFQNRNRILGASGPLWVTVPVLQTGRSQQTIREAVIDETGNPRWRRKHLASWEQAYSPRPHAEAILPFLRELYGRPWERLADFNRAAIDFLFAAFEIRAEVVWSSSLPSSGSSTGKLAGLCAAVGATTYLSGISGRDYLDESVFKAAGIAVEYQNFLHPIYRQRSQPFVPCMSSFDLLANEGPESARILRAPERTLEKAFL